MQTADIHAALAPIQFLIGSWHGRGSGSYPTIEDFSYEEDLEFWHTGRPWLAFVQKTRSPSGEPMHSEMGYLRPQRGGAIEAVIAHAFGVVEVLSGTVADASIELDSTQLTSAPSAKTVHATRRELRLDGDDLTYLVAMAYGDHPLRAHLDARLTRAG